MNWDVHFKLLQNNDCNYYQLGKTMNKKHILSTGWRLVKNLSQAHPVPKQQHYKCLMFSDPLNLQALNIS